MIFRKQEKTRRSGRELRRITCRPPRAGGWRKPQPRHRTSSGQTSPAAPHRAAAAPAGRRSAEPTARETWRRWPAAAGRLPPADPPRAPNGPRRSKRTQRPPQRPGPPRPAAASRDGRHPLLPAAASRPLRVPPAALEGEEGEGPVSKRGKAPGGLPGSRSPSPPGEAPAIPATSPRLPRRQGGRQATATPPRRARTQSFPQLGRVPRRCRGSGFSPPPPPSPAPSPCPGRQREKVSLTAAEARENQPQQPQPRPGRHRRAEPPQPLLPPSLPPPPPPPPGVGTAAGRCKKFPAGWRSRRREDTNGSLRSGFGPCHAPGSAPSRRRYDTRPPAHSRSPTQPPPRTGCVCH